MLSSSSFPDAPKSTTPTAVATTVSTRLAVGVAIGFIAGILGGSYGFALLSNRITPTPAPAPIRSAPSAPAADQCQTGCANTYNFTKGGPTYNIDVQLCVKTCKDLLAIGGVPGIAPSNPQGGSPSVKGGNVPGLAPANPGTPNPTLAHKCADGTTLAMGVPCPQGGATPSQPNLCPDGTPNTSTDGKCYCPGTTIVMNATTICPTTPTPTPTSPCAADMSMGSDGICHPSPVVPCLDLCSTDARACVVAGNSTQVCTQRLTLCVNKCQPQTPGTPKRCPDGSLMPSSGTCPTPKVPCLTQCNNAYTTCAYTPAANVSTQQAFCLAQLTVCTNQCAPNTPTTNGGCPAGKTMSSAGLCQ